MTQNSQMPFEAMMKVQKLSNKLWSNGLGRFIPRKITRFPHFVIPLIIIDGPLFESYVDNSGEITLNPINRGTIHLQLKNQYTGEPFSTIMIVNEVGLESFAQEMKNLFKYFEYFMKMK